MDTTAGWKRGDYKRACDICGHPWKRSVMRGIGQGRLACPDDYRGLTAEQISRYNASVPPLRVRNHKNVRLPREVDTYFMAEADIFNQVCAFGGIATLVGPTGGIISTTNQPSTTAACGVYLGEIVEENLRPTHWIVRAKAKLIEFADLLIASQFGGGVSPSLASTDLTYGGIQDLTLQNTEITARAGEVFLYAYGATGESRYLAAADRCAQFLRHTQRADVALPVFSTFTNGGSDRRYVGGIPMFVTHGIKAIDGRYQVRAVGCLAFLAKLRQVRGGSYAYGEATPGADFSASTLGTIDQMIADITAFAETGPVPTGSSTPVSGLSPATPRTHFSCGNSNATGGSGTWVYFNGTTILVLDHAKALNGLFATGGYTAFVASVYQSMLGATSNPSFHPLSTDTPTRLANSSRGAYDPAICQTVTLETTPVLTNSASSYSLPTAGYLAPVIVAAGGSLKALKDALNKPRRLVGTAFGPNPIYDYAANSSCGLSFQRTTMSRFPASLSEVGRIYRYPPQANSNVRAS